MSEEIEPWELEDGKQVEDPEDDKYLLIFMKSIVPNRIYIRVRRVNWNERGCNEGVWKFTGNKHTT
jgi:hypothetical protein